MKTVLVAATFALAVATPLSADAADDHSGHGGHRHVTAPADAPLIEGLVKKVDKAAGKVTVSHGPLPNGMPAMTMVFRLKDATWIDKMKEGSKIRFLAEEINGAMTLIRFEPAK